MWRCNRVPYNNALLRLGKFFGILPFSYRFNVLDSIHKLAWILLLLCYCGIVFQEKLNNDLNLHLISVFMQIMNHLSSIWINLLVFKRALTAKADYKHLFQKIREVDGLLRMAHEETLTFRIIWIGAGCFASIKFCERFISIYFGVQILLLSLHDIFDLNVYLVTCLIYVFAQSILCRCSVLHRTLTRILRAQKISFVFESNHGEYAKCLDVYTILMDFMHVFNRVFGRIMFLMYVRTILFCLNVINNMLTFASSEMYITVFIFVMASALGTLFVALYECTMIVSSIVRIRAKLQEILISVQLLQYYSNVREDKDKGDLQQLRFAIARKPLIFSAGGFLDVNYTMLFSIAVIVLSYTLVLISDRMD